MGFSIRLPFVIVILCLGATILPNRCRALKLPALAGEGGGNIETSNCYKLLGRFAFLQGGDDFDNLKYSFNYRNESNHNLWLAAYSDEALNPLAEAEFHGKGTSCWDKLLDARDQALVLINLFERLNGTAQKCSDGSNTLKGSLRIYYEGYTYISIIHVDPVMCNRTGGVSCQGPLMNVNYSMHLTNSPESAKVFHTEISADESPYAYFCMLALPLGILNFLIAAITTVKLRKLKKWHYIPKGVAFASLCLMLCNLFWVVHYTYYSATGRPASITALGITVFPIRLLSQFLWLMADEALVVSMLCLAKGWTLVRKKMSPRSRAMYGVLLVVYVFVGWAALIWAGATSNISNSISLWDTPGGLMLAGWRLVIFGFFIWAVLTTLRQYQQKKGFFCKMGVLFSFWFLSMPILAVFSVSGAIAPHFRFGVIQIINMLCLFVALLLLNVMYWPGIKLSKKFPFHSFNLHSKATLAKLKKEASKKMSKRGDAAGLTQEEKDHLTKQEEQARFNMMDPLTRLAELLKKYESETQACMDFAAELRVGLREIDDVNAQADEADAEDRSRRRDRTNRRKDTADKRHVKPENSSSNSNSDDDKDGNVDRREEPSDVKEGGRRRRRRRNRDDKSDSAAGTADTEQKTTSEVSSGGRRQRRTRRRDTDRANVDN